MAAGALCVILGAGFLEDRVWSINPDAVATAGAVLAIAAEAGPDRVVLAVEGPLAGRMQDIARQSAGPEAAMALSASVCPPGAGRAMAVDTADRDPSGDPSGGAMPWPPGMADAGAGPAAEIARAVRELVGLAVPRPLPPEAHPVKVLRLPAGTGEDTLMAYAFASAWTSWVTTAGGVYLALDDGAGDPALPAGARQLAGPVPLGRLRLLASDPPEDVQVLDQWAGGRLALCPDGCVAGDAWLAHRFNRDPPPP